MQKYALLVGINRYADPGNDLSGCVHDIEDMRQHLIVRGWADAHFLELRDEYATKLNIMDGLFWLFNAPPKNEPAELLFQYSGHGSQVRTSDPTEPDHLSEILCPHDQHLWWDDPITDKSLRSVFGQKKESDYLTVILDCCHSGTGTRNGIRPPGTPKKSRYLECPSHGAGLAIDMPTDRLGVKQRAGYRATSDDMNHLLMAACGSRQTSADACFGGRYNGAFTWALLRALRVLPSDAKTHDIFHRAALMVREEGFEQKPQIEGRKLFHERMFLGGQ